MSFDPFKPSWNEILAHILLFLIVAYVFVQCMRSGSKAQNDNYYCTPVWEGPYS